MLVRASTPRRGFFRKLAASAVVVPLAACHGGTVHGARSFAQGYGRLKPALPLNTVEVVSSGVFDYQGQPLIALPDGFRYWAVSCTGQAMTDGTLVPGDHDGMGCFPGPGGSTILVRNHELGEGEARFGNSRGVDVRDQLKFDSHANGGTTTLVLDDRGRLLRHYASLGGTNNNCAGGPTPWGTWLTCEESTALPSTALPKFEQRHGYVFEVPAAASQPVRALPIAGMGRFRHEATAADPRSGFVYQTEDEGDGLFYRYIPRQPGRLLAGGALQALKLKEAVASVDTSTGFLPRLNQPLPVEWVDIPDPDPQDNVVVNSVRAQGRAQGAARFRRGEGAWFGMGRVYFCCTRGGEHGAGQIWAHDPVAETLSLVVESTDRAVLDMPDNITLGRDGRLYMFEDGSDGNFIVGLNTNGKLFHVAHNRINDSEFCGGCFSHNGRFLFVNLQIPGITLVIEGPWHKQMP